MRARAVLAGFAACAVTAFAAVGADPAQAAMSFEPCTPAGFECGSLAVPLARGAAARGSLVLRATRRRVGAAPSASAVVPLAGGPGQAALPLAADFAEVLAPALAQRDLLVFDERGTGRSGRLSCRALDNGGTSIAAVNSCAAELGAVRAAYRTADTVADLEDLRREAGYERLVLVGVSYGTKVALDYAAAHPDRVEALVLDSVVPPEGWDPLLRPSLVAVPRVMRALCAQAACRGITSDPVRDLRTLVRRVARRPARARRCSTRAGGRLSITVDPLGVFDVLLAGDENPTLRSDLPAAVRGALRGDLRPLLRLRLRAAGLIGQPSRARLQGPLSATRAARSTRRRCAAKPACRGARRGR
jgi:pimeloyl-ACP methyl ester carboxylesterase